jgi:hypothetical protein
MNTESNRLNNNLNHHSIVSYAHSDSSFIALMRLDRENHTYAQVGSSFVFEHDGTMLLSLHAYDGEQMYFEVYE